jgi:hypothetical protein
MEQSGISLQLTSETNLGMDIHAASHPPEDVSWLLA